METKALKIFCDPAAAAAATDTVGQRHETLMGHLWGQSLPSPTFPRCCKRKLAAPKKHRRRARQVSTSALGAKTGVPPASRRCVPLTQLGHLVLSAYVCAEDLYAA